MARNSALLLLILLVVMPIAYAGDDYRCTISNVTLVDGTTGARHQMYKSSVGAMFTVERESGLIAGALKNSYRTKPQVIDRGSKENSYKVVTTMKLHEGAGLGTTIHVLIVKEFEPTPKKPFVFLENDAVYFGTCEHF